MRHHQRHADKSGTKSDHSSPPGKTARLEGRRDNVRLTIAHMAARLIAEGHTDYHAAKQKAARQLGVNDHDTLPDNHEIEAALREHLSLFANDTQPQVLAALRATALRLMERLEQFSPWLVGAVLTGTANEFSEIELELVGVEAKNFEMYLLNAGVEFQLSESHRASDRSRQREAITYKVEFAGAPVSISLYEHHAARQAAHPRDSIKHERADRAEAEKIFSGNDQKL